MNFDKFALLDLLTRYVRGAVSLAELHDLLTLNLADFFAQATDADVELLEEIHSAIFEVEDGAMDEAAFKVAAQELVSQPSAT